MLRLLRLARGFLDPGAADSSGVSTDHRKIRRVAVTGGPAAGKTAILDVLRRHLDRRVVVLPESATTLFSGGFPRPKEECTHCSLGWLGGEESMPCRCC